MRFCIFVSSFFNLAMNSIENPLISVIIPIYNREERLPKTLQSLADQTHRPMEVILVDNGSTDHSSNICYIFKDEHNKSIAVKVIHELKKGANAARNTGISYATGDYLMFFDSDDIMYPNCLERIVQYLKVNNYPEVVAFPSVIQLYNGKASRRPHLYSTNPADHLFNTLLPTHSFCIQRKSLERVGPWDETLERWQDLEYGFRVLLKSTSLSWMRGKPLYEVLQHKESISGNGYFLDHEKMYASLMKIQRDIDCLSNLMDTQRTRRALCYRICTVAAQIRYEGNEKLGKEYLSKALSLLPEERKKVASTLLRFQFGYEGRGGRGFWRVARILL